MQILKIDGKPAACFGLHQPPGGKARFTYLILFKPDPKGESGTGTGGELRTEGINSDGKIVCDLKMEAFAGKHKIPVNYTLDADAKGINSETLTVEGKDYGKDGPRVFLLDLGDEKAKCLAIKQIPETVPEFADEKAWGKQILQAVKELKEKSAEAKSFFAGKK
jgi:hypothetical protein